MRLEILRGLVDPVVIDDVSRVLITKDDGTPLAIASEWGRAIFVGHAGEGQQFPDLLKALGVDRTVISTIIDASKG